MEFVKIINAAHERKVKENERKVKVSEKKNSIVMDILYGLAGLIGSGMIFAFMVLFALIF